MIVIDRIENDIVVVEINDSFVNIPKSVFNEEINEGDVLVLSVDKQETKNIKEMLGNKLNSLFNISKVV